MNHLWYSVGYSEGFDEGRNAGRYDRRPDLLTILFRLAFSILHLLVVYSPMLIVGWLFAREFAPADALTQIITTLIAAYGLFSVIFFLKGLLIALKSLRNAAWLLLWLVCVLFVCPVPALTAMEFIRSDVQLPDAVRWLMAFVFGLYLYFRYRLTTDGAPGIVSWAYRFGWKLVHSSRHVTRNVSASVHHT